MGRRIVVVFGGSSPRPGSPGYSQAERLGAALSRRGLAVATGGYMGTMEAVSKGAAGAGGHVIGVTCAGIERWRPVKPNPWIVEHIRVATLHERVRRLIELGEAYIALPGGLGTLSEIALTWSMMQTEEITPKPFYLVGEPWRSTFETFFQHGRGYLSQQDIDRLQQVDEVEEAVKGLERSLDGGE